MQYIKERNEAREAERFAKYGNPEPGSKFANPNLRNQQPTYVDRTFSQPGGLRFVDGDGNFKIIEGDSLDDYLDRQDYSQPNAYNQEAIMNQHKSIWSRKFSRINGRCKYFWIYVRCLFQELK